MPPTAARELIPGVCTTQAAATQYRRLHIQKDWRLIYRDDGDTLGIERLVHKSKLDQEAERVAWEDLNGPP